jgi:membrane associated rhomboid family serine protease
LFLYNIYFNIKVFLVDKEDFYYRILSIMGLYDRSYFRQSAPQYTPCGSKHLWILVGINILFFFLAPIHSALFTNFSLIPIPGQFWGFQLVTSAFLHFDFWHLFFNVWGLLLFGKFLIRHVTVKNFYLIYFIGVIVGSLLFLLFYWNSNLQLIGASGAVCAIMVGAAMFEPNEEFRLIIMPFTPIKMSTMIIAYTVLEALLQVSKASSGISHLCHLGGFLGGYIAVKALCKRDIVWDPLKKLFGDKKIIKETTQTDYSNKNAEDLDPNTPVTSKQLDELLDKISREGINSLSPYELALLRKARQQMRGE